MENIKQLVKTAALLASRGKSSCIDCDKNYCCVSQKHIEISQTEFDNIEHIITPEQETRAKDQVIWMRHPANLHRVFTCPFNDPETGMCEIYDERPFVCAQYMVVNPKEDCDSSTMKGLSIVNPANIVNILMNGMQFAPAVQAIRTMVSGKPMNMIDSWELYLKKKGIL